MLVKRLGVLLVFIACILALSACGSGGSSIQDILKQNGINADTAAKMKIELRYLKESKGSNYQFVDKTGDAGFLSALLEGLTACYEAEKPVDKQYTPELRADCELCFTDGSGNSVSFYYVSQEGLLIFPTRKKEKDSETLIYRYYGVGDGLAKLIQAQQQHAALKQEVIIKPFRNMEELKSSIDAEELAEEGTELDFEFFTEAAPQNIGTACCIYTSVQFKLLPDNSFLIMAYGKTKTGEQQKLSILGLEANSHYTKVIVAEPDEALDSVNTGEAAPESFAVTILKNTIDMSKWIVFVDADNRILDVIVPEDIEGMTMPGTGTNAGPTGTAGADASPGPDATATADEVGSGD